MSRRTRPTDSSRLATRPQGEMPVPEDRNRMAEIHAVNDQQELPLVDLDTLAWPSICQAYLERTGRDISNDDQLRMIVDINREMFVAVWEFLLATGSDAMAVRLKKFTEESDKLIADKERQLNERVIITATTLGNTLQLISKREIVDPLNSQIKEFKELVDLLRDNESAKKAKWIITGLSAAALTLLTGVFAGMGMAWFFRPT